MLKMYSSTKFIEGKVEGSGTKRNRDTSSPHFGKQIHFLDVSNCPE